MGSWLIETRFYFDQGVYVHGIHGKKYFIFSPIMKIMEIMENHGNWVMTMKFMEEIMENESLSKLVKIMKL